MNLENLKPDAGFDELTVNTVGVLVIHLGTRIGEVIEVESDVPFGVHVKFWDGSPNEWVSEHSLMVSLFNTLKGVKQ